MCLIVERFFLIRLGKLRLFIEGSLLRLLLYMYLIQCIGFMFYIMIGISIPGCRTHILLCGCLILHLI